MLIHLPSHLKAFVEKEVASGRYRNESQVIEDALSRFADEAEPDFEPTMTLAEAIAEPLAQLERGEGRELTDEVWEEILRQSELDAVRGLPVRDEIKY
jgi:putative addiction module CopG family antidote